MCKNNKNSSAIADRAIRDAVDSHRLAVQVPANDGRATAGPGGGRMNHSHVIQISMIWKRDFPRPRRRVPDPPESRFDGLLYALVNQQADADGNNERKQSLDRRAVDDQHVMTGASVRLQAPAMGDPMTDVEERFEETP